MGGTRLISREARAYIIEQIHDHGQMSKSEVTDLVRPHCTFDPITLENQAINRLVGSICRSIRDEKGTRSVFVAKGRDAIVDIDTSTSLPLITRVDEQLAANIKGLQASKKKTALRRAELSGQTSIFESAPKKDAFDFGAVARS